MTNNSLREEIIQSIKDNVDNMAWNETTEICANEVLKLFEKRIDSKLKMLRKLNPSEKEIIYTQGYNSAIYDITEILK